MLQTCASPCEDQTCSFVERQVSHLCCYNNYFIFTVKGEDTDELRIGRCNTGTSLSPFGIVNMMVIFIPLLWVM